MLRLVSLILVLTLSFLFLALPAGAEDLPEGAISVTGYSSKWWYYLDSVTHNNAFDYIYYQRVNTQTLTVTGLNSTSYTWIFPFFALQDESGTRQNLSEGVTYHVNLTFTNNLYTGFNNLTSNVIMASTSSNMTSLDPAAGFTYNLTELIGANNVSITVTNSIPISEVDIVFYIPASTLPAASLPYFAPMIYFVGSEFTISYASITGYIDQNRSVFENLINQQIADVISILQSNADQAHQDSLNEQHWAEQLFNVFNDGTEDHPDTGTVDDLESLEGSINDSISTVTLPDGSTVSTSDAVMSKVKDYFYSVSSNAQFNSTAAEAFNSVFNTFVPYVGLLIFFNLSLALGISFLSGRRAGT